MSVQNKKLAKWLGIIGTAAAVILIVPTIFSWSVRAITIWQSPEVIKDNTNRIGGIEAWRATNDFAIHAQLDRIEQGQRQIWKRLQTITAEPDYSGTMTQTNFVFR